MTSNNGRLTFAEFQATGQDKDDLRAHAEHLADAAFPVPGRLYARNLVIECNNGSEAAKGPWYVDTGSWDQYGDLLFVEQELYAFYASECGDDDIRAYLIDAAPASNYRGDRSNIGRDALTDVYSAFGAYHGYALGCANEMAFAGADNAGKEFPQEHRQWLGEFIRRWEAMERAEDEARVLAEKSEMLEGAPVVHVFDHLLEVAEKRVALFKDGYKEGRAARSALLDLLLAAHRADGDMRPGRPERGPGFSDEQWALIQRGWDMHADSVYGSGLRKALTSIADSDTLEALAAERSTAKAHSDRMTMGYAGVVGLLCSLSTRITDEEEQEMLDRAVAEWCELSGWTWRRVIDNVEVFPPQ